MPERNIVIIAVATIVGVGCFSSAATSRYSAVFGYAMNTINERGLYEKTQQELFDAAMKGMLGSLDVNSNYFSNEEFIGSTESMEQKYVGVGMTVGIDTQTQRLIVVAPAPNSPALDAGIKAGDFIVAINGEPASKLTPAQAVPKIKGPAGETVSITIGRGEPEELIDLEVVRAEIHTPSVKGDVLGTDGTWDFRLSTHPRIGYIRVTQFVNHTVEEMEEAIKKVDGNVDSIIIDLRGNLGGLLDAAIKISDMFLPSDKLIVETRGRNSQIKQQEYSRTKPLVSNNIPIVILINGESASASEIVSACLQDHQRCVVAGQRSYGKGTVQEVIPLERGRAKMHLTTATYWRPSGRNIHRLPGLTDEDQWGVVPNDGMDVELDPQEWAKIQLQRSERDIENFNGEESMVLNDDSEPVPDRQLDKAIEYLLSLTQGEVT